MATRELRFRLLYPGEEDRYQLDTPLEHHCFSSLSFRIPTIVAPYITKRYMFTLEKTPAGLTCIGCGRTPFTTSHFTCPNVMPYVSKLITPRQEVAVDSNLIDALCSRKR
ncbi:hypothetical protein SARC_07166, partial [Sphaeroforma arctica JP610]